MRLYDFTVNSIAGNPFDWTPLKGKKILVVNTASECGLTPQFALLEELFQEFGGENFTVIGFPSNDFAGQDPGSNEQIYAFCTQNYGVTFPMMEKIVVKGEQIHPLYKWLTETTGSDVKWNFHKFLINENGEVVKSIDPQVLPVDEEIINWVQ